MMSGCLDRGDEAIEVISTFKQISKQNAKSNQLNDIKCMENGDHSTLFTIVLPKVDENSLQQCKNQFI